MSDEGTVALTWEGADGTKTAVVTVTTTGAMSVDHALDALLDGLRLTTDPCYAVGKVQVRELKTRTRPADPPPPRRPPAAEGQPPAPVALGTARPGRRGLPDAGLIVEPVTAEPTLRPVGEA